MIVFLKQEQSLLEPILPYLELSGDFSLAAFGEDRIPMGELWIDACFDPFAPVDTTSVYRFFSEVHRVLEQWKACRVRLLLSPLFDSAEPEFKKYNLLLENFTLFFEKAYGVLPLYIPALLEQPSMHPVIELIRCIRSKEEESFLWSEKSLFHVAKALHCAELLQAPLPEEACLLRGRACTLAEVEQAAVMLWGREKIHFEDAYTIEERYLPLQSLGEEEEPLERLLFSLL